MTSSHTQTLSLSTLHGNPWRNVTKPQRDLRTIVDPMLCQTSCHSNSVKTPTANNIYASSGHCVLYDLLLGVSRKFSLLPVHPRRLVYTDMNVCIYNKISVSLVTTKIMTVFECKVMETAPFRIGPIRQGFKVRHYVHEWEFSVKMVDSPLNMYKISIWWPCIHDWSILHRLQISFRTKCGQHFVSCTFFNYLTGASTALYRAGSCGQAVTSKRSCSKCLHTRSGCRDLWLDICEHARMFFLWWWLGAVPLQQCCIADRNQGPHTLKQMDKQVRGWRSRRYSATLHTVRKVVGSYFLWVHGCNHIAHHAL